MAEFLSVWERMPYEMNYEPDEGQRVNKVERDWRTGALQLHGRRLFLSECTERHQ